MHFLAPYLLGGLVLASAPLIIHLLNRRRFRVVDWAPMHYLKLTIRTNRRRLRIEQLILLALRTLAVILLVVTIARPVLSNTAGGWLGGRTRTSRIYVLDDSLSMGYQTDRRSAFDRGKEALATLLRSVGAQDSITVFTTSAAESPLARNAISDDPGHLLGLVGQLGVTDTASNWPATFKAADEYVSASPFPTREVVIVTDLRRSGWQNVSDVAGRWAGRAVTLKIIDVGSRQTANLSVESLEQEDSVALPDSPVRVKARIGNHGPAAVSGAQAVLAFGNEVRPVLLPNLATGGTTDVPLSVTPGHSGQYPLRLSLPADALPADDSRWLNIDVRPNLELLLFDGQPSPVPFESATDFLAAALTVGAHPWQVQKRSDLDRQAISASTADVIVLADVASISAEQAAALETFVKAGGGLMIFSGDQLDADLYNRRLYRGGDGLLPCRLDKVVDEPVTGLVIEASGPSALTPLARLAPGSLSRVAARKYLGVAVSARDRAQGARVLARWNDAAAGPACVQKRFGLGTVLLCTVTADRKWSDWPVDPTYVLAVRSAAMALARPAGRQDTLTAGQPIQYPLGQSTMASNPRVSGPAIGTQAAVLSRSGAGLLLRYAGTTHAGVYTLSWKDPAAKEYTHLFCVNGDRAESDLTPITDEQLRGLLGSLRPAILHYTGGRTSFVESGKEVWRTLAIVLLALFVVESAFAAWVGRER